MAETIVIIRCVYSLEGRTGVCCEIINSHGSGVTVKIDCNVTFCSLVDRYQSFAKKCCHILQSTHTFRVSCVFLFFYCCTVTRKHTRQKVVFTYFQKTNAGDFQYQIDGLKKNTENLGQ